MMGKLTVSTVIISLAVTTPAVSGAAAAANASLISTWIASRQSAQTPNQTELVPNRWIDPSDAHAADSDSTGTVASGATLTASFIIISVILSTIVVCTFVGNLFVVVAILVDKNLQTAANLLVLSLAVADFMVACLVMPLGAYNELYQGWYLGKEVCEFWTSADVLCCTASILNLLAIAMDRYWAVTNVDYIYRRTRRRVTVMIICAWTVGAVVSLAPIFGWKDPDFAYRVLVEHKCMVSQDVGYQIFATISTFYAPLVLLLALYWRIFQVARKRIRHKPGSCVNSKGARQPQQPGVGADEAARTCSQVYIVGVNDGNNNGGLGHAQKSAMSPMVPSVRLGSASSSTLNPTASKSLSDTDAATIVATEATLTITTTTADQRRAHKHRLDHLDSSVNGEEEDSDERVPGTTTADSGRGATSSQALTNDYDSDRQAMHCGATEQKIPIGVGHHSSSAGACCGDTNVWTLLQAINKISDGGVNPLCTSANEQSTTRNRHQWRQIRIGAGEQEAGERRQQLDHDDKGIKDKKDRKGKKGRRDRHVCCASLLSNNTQDRSVDDDNNCVVGNANQYLPIVPDNKPQQTVSTRPATKTNDSDAAAAEFEHSSSGAPGELSKSQPLSVKVDEGNGNGRTFGPVSVFCLSKQCVAGHTTKSQCCLYNCCHKCCVESNRKDELAHNVDTSALDDGAERALHKGLGAYWKNDIDASSKSKDMGAFKVASGADKVVVSVEERDDGGIRKSSSRHRHHHSRLDHHHRHRYGSKELGQGYTCAASNIEISEHTAAADSGRDRLLYPSAQQQPQINHISRSEAPEVEDSLKTAPQRQTVRVAAATGAEYLATDRVDRDKSGSTAVSHSTAKSREDIGVGGENLSPSVIGFVAGTSDKNTHGNGAGSLAAAKQRRMQTTLRQELQGKKKEHLQQSIGKHSHSDHSKRISGEENAQQLQRQHRNHFCQLAPSISMSSSASSASSGSSSASSRSTSASASLASTPSTPATLFSTSSSSSTSLSSASATTTSSPEVAQAAAPIAAQPSDDDLISTSIESSCVRPPAGDSATTTSGSSSDDNSHCDDEESLSAAFPPPIDLCDKAAIGKQSPGGDAPSNAGEGEAGAKTKTVDATTKRQRKGVNEVGQVTIDKARQVKLKQLDARELLSIRPRSDCRNRHRRQTPISRAASVQVVEFGDDSAQERQKKGGAAAATCGHSKMNDNKWSDEAQRRRNLCYTITGSSPTAANQAEAPAPVPASTTTSVLRRGRKAAPVRSHTSANISSASGLMPATASLDLRRKFKALGQMISFVQTSRQFTSSSSTHTSTQSGDDEHSSDDGGDGNDVESPAATKQEPPCDKSDDLSMVDQPQNTGPSKKKLQQPRSSSRQHSLRALFYVYGISSRRKRRRATASGTSLAVAEVTSSALDDEPVPAAVVTTTTSNRDTLRPSLVLRARQLLHAPSAAARTTVRPVANIHGAASTVSGLSDASPYPASSADGYASDDIDVSTTTTANTKDPRPTIESNEVPILAPTRRPQHSPALAVVAAAAGGEKSRKPEDDRDNDNCQMSVVKANTDAVIRGDDEQDIIQAQRATTTVQTTTTTATGSEVQLQTASTTADSGSRRNHNQIMHQQQQHRSRLGSLRKRSRTSKDNMDIKRERKAAKTLAIITGVFVCCWLPFFLNAVVMPICGPRCTPSDLVLSVLLWLGYLNSLLNPLIYTIFSPDFRRAFRRLLCWSQLVTFAGSVRAGGGGAGTNLGVAVPLKS